MTDYKEIYYKLIASLTLAEHMGDAGEDVDEAMRLTDPDFINDGPESLKKYLHNTHKTTTLYGSTIWDDDEDEKGIILND